MSLKKENIRFYNYFPLESLGGGERISIALLNFLKDYLNISYVSDVFTKGYKRVKLSEIEKLIKFEYCHLEFKHNFFIDLFSKIINPAPKYEDLKGDKLSLIFLATPLQRHLIKRIYLNNHNTILLWHGLTFEWLRIAKLAQIFILIRQIFYKLNFRIYQKYYRPPHIFHQIVNENQRKFLIKLGIDPKQIFFIPNGIDFTTYKIKSNENFNILFIGGLNNMVKGISFLKDLIKITLDLLPNVNFTILGSGGDEYILSRKFTKVPNVVLKGFVSGPAKYEEIANSNLLIVTSNIETYSIAILEGLASGLPVVSRDLSGPSTILSMDTLFGKIVEDDIHKFALAIRHYYSEWKNSKSIYYANKLKRRTKALKLFNEGQMLEKYITMIRAAEYFSSKD